MCKLYLGNLKDQEESALREYFEQFGQIVSINIPVNKDSGERRGFGFIEFDDYDCVDKIICESQLI